MEVVTALASIRTISYLTQKELKRTVKVSEKRVIFAHMAILS